VTSNSLLDFGVDSDHDTERNF